MTGFALLLLTIVLGMAYYHTKHVDDGKTFTERYFGWMREWLERKRSE